MAVVILGMHRGGTSALAGALHRLGLPVGPTQELMGATAANVQGHWELAALSQLDEELLVHLGGRWSGPPNAGAEVQRRLAGGSWGERADALLDRLLPGGSWVWKDPRACLLLPFWRSVLDRRGVTPVVVAVVRHPSEVAASLGRRDALPSWYSVGLWERYLRRAAGDSDGLATWVVTYDELVERPAPVLAATAAYLADHGERLDPRAVDEAASFLDPGSRHHHGGVHDPELPAAQRRLVELLLARTGEQTGRWGADLGEETPGLQAWFDEHHRLLGFRDLSEQLRVGLEDLAARKDAERAELHARKDAEIAGLGASVARLEEWLAQERADAGRAWAEVRRLEEEARDLEAARHAVVEALETTIVERDGWKWAVLQHERRPGARARQVIRRALVGEDQ